MPGERAPVDVAGTNEALTLGGSALAQFGAVPAGSDQVLHWADVARSHDPLAPEKLSIVILAGGMSFRTDGKVHPLLDATDSRTGETRTLIAWQCERINRSCLAPARVCLVGNPFTEPLLRAEMARWTDGRLPLLYSSGLAPVLFPEQSRTGETRCYRGPTGEPVLNPAGHFEALRWLVLNGILGEMAEDEVVLFISYSNWGRIYTEETLSLAKMAADWGRGSDDFLLLGEVSQSPVRAQSPGSFLTLRDGEPSALRLVKFNYGLGSFRWEPERPIFMSTNTLYFSVGSLLARLRRAAASLGGANPVAGVREMLRAARAGRRRAELSAVVDRAFPIPPQLMATRKGGRIEDLRIERDLDQVTLLPGSPYRAVEVGAERAVFLKLPSDFDDPRKKALIFGGDP